LKIEKENTHERTEGYDHGLGASQESLTIMKGKVTDQQLASHDIIMKDKNSFGTVIHEGIMKESTMHLIGNDRQGHMMTTVREKWKTTGSSPIITFIILRYKRFMADVRFHRYIHRQEKEST
jgi:hypothetical protein